MRTHAADILPPDYNEDEDDDDYKEGLQLSQTILKYSSSSGLETPLRNPIQDILTEK
jgi:hypothetical protein